MILVGFLHLEERGNHNMEWLFHSRPPCQIKATSPTSRLFYCAYFRSHFLLKLSKQLDVVLHFTHSNCYHGRWNGSILTLERPRRGIPIFPTPPTPIRSTFRFSGGPHAPVNMADSMALIVLCKPVDIQWVSRAWLANQSMRKTLFTGILCTKFNYITTVRCSTCLFEYQTMLLHVTNLARAAQGPQSLVW